MIGKKQKGITLVALIITIIILLILAGVTISITLGENGLFKTAKQATEEYIKSQLKEELEIEIVNIRAKKIALGETFKREHLLELANIGATVESTDIPAEGEYKNYGFEIDENYSVTILEKIKGEKPNIVGEVITPGIVAKGETVEIKVTASIAEGSIKTIKSTNGATLKTDASNTEKIFTVTENGTYYFEATTDAGRKATVGVTVDTIMEAPEINIKDITDTNFTIVVTNNYAEGLVTEYRYYVDGIAKSTGTTNKEYTQTGLTQGTKHSNIYVEAYFGTSKLKSEVKEVTTLNIQYSKIQNINTSIDSLNNITQDSYDTINNIVVEYNSLTSEEKTYITNYEKLKNAVETFNSLGAIGKFNMPILTSNDCVVDGLRYIVSARSQLNASCQAYQVFDDRFTRVALS